MTQATEPNPNEDIKEVLTDEQIAERATTKARELAQLLHEAHDSDHLRAERLDIDILAHRFIDNQAWDTDTTAADVLIREAAQLRTTENPTEAALAAAAQCETIAVRLAELGGFTLRTAEQLDHTDTAQPPVADQTTNTSLTGAPEQPSGPGDNLPDQVAEQALLGSLLHAPDVVPEIAKFLRADDFSDPRLAATYTTITTLHDVGELIDVSTYESSADRQKASHTNHQRVLSELRQNQPSTRPASLIADLTTAAHHDNTGNLLTPDAQLRMARTVLADAARRAVTQAGIRTHRAARATRWGVHRQHSIDTATTVLAELDTLAQRLGAAGHPTSHDAASQLNGLLDQSRPDRASTRFTGLFTRRAERDLIHLALRGNTEVLRFIPQDFANRAHANTWRAIQALYDRREPVNYVSVYTETRALPARHRTTLSAQQLQHLEQRDLISAVSMTRSLETIAKSALRRNAATLETSLHDVATNRDLSSSTVVTAAQAGHRQLTNQIQASASRTR